MEHKLKDNLTLTGTITASNINFVNPSSLTKEPTGFVSPELVVINYDSTNRTITLTGTVDAYWRGVKIDALVSGWVSTAHTATNGTWYLYYNGSSFVWSQTVWTFNMVQIAFVYYSTNDKFALRECHSLMSWQTHKELHETIGTYRNSGGDFSNYVLASTTAANRRSFISACLIDDEDLPTNNPALNTNSYCLRYLTSTGVTTFTTIATDIIALLTNNPYYNQFTGGNWIQTLMPNNSYAAIFVLTIPTTSDSGSQAYRYQFIQPQSTSGSLSTIQALTIDSVILGDAILSEFAFIQKIIVRFTGGNWVISGTTKLTGNRQNAVSLQGSFLSSVNTTTDFSGVGTLTNPLALVNKDGFFDYNHSGTTQAYTSGNMKVLNDGAGAYTTSLYAPFGITDLLNTTTNQFDFSGLSLGDEVMLRIDYIVTTTANNQIVNGFMTFDIGGTPYNLTLGSSYFKVVGTYNIIKVVPFYIGNEGTLNNPAELYFDSDAAATLQVNGFYISAKRRKI